MATLESITNTYKSIVGSRDDSDMCFTNKIPDPIFITRIFNLSSKDLLFYLFQHSVALIEEGNSNYEHFYLFISRLTFFSKEELNSLEPFLLELGKVDCYRSYGDNYDEELDLPTYMDSKDNAYNWIRDELSFPT